MTNIQILGVSEHEQTVRMKTNIQMALSRLGLDIAIQEISAVDQFLAAKISAIPALRIGGKIVAQEEIPSVDDLVILFKVLFKPIQKSVVEEERNE